MKIISQYAAMFILLISNIIYLSNIPTPVEKTSDDDFASEYFNFNAPEEPRVLVDSTILEPILESNPYHQHLLNPVVKLSFLKPVRMPNGSIVGADLQSSATGFSVAYNRKTNVSYILTNNHFCDDVIETNGLIIAQNGDQIRTDDPGVDPMQGKPVYVSPERDLCLVDIKGYIEPSKLAVEEHRVHQLDQVIIVGAPLGLFPVLIQSNVASWIPRDYPEIQNLHMTTEGSPFLMLSALIEPGNSGSPVYDDHDQVIGIIFAGFNESYGAIAIPLDDIRNFLNEAGVEV